MTKMLKVLAIAAMGCLAVNAPAFSQTNYPTGIVKLVVGFPPGGPTDLMARIIADGLSDVWGQRVIVENKPGASGTIAGAQVARAKPDGYTLILANNASHGAFEVLNPKETQYHTLQDFEPVSLIGGSPLVMIASKGSGVTTLADFIKKARAEPGAVKYGSSAAGSGPHLAGELLKVETGIDMPHVPYNGAAPVMQAVVGNFVQMYMGAPTTVMEQVEAGNAVTLAISSEKRLDEYPKIPTFREQGIDIVMESNFGLMAPKGTPEPILDKINRDMSALLAPGGKMRAQLFKLGYLANPTSRAAFTKKIEEEIAKIRYVVKAARMETP